MHMGQYFKMDALPHVAFMCCMGMGCFLVDEQMPNVLRVKLP